jgi:hypothetical protein
VPSVPPHFADYRSFWFLVAGGPLGILALAGVVRGGKRLAARVRARAESRATFVRKTIGEARNAARKNDHAGVASAVERAVYASIEEGLGLRARAVLRDKLDFELAEHGADRALAEETVKLLDLCETLKFAGNANQDFRSILERASSVADRLARVDRRERRKKAA